MKLNQFAKEWILPFVIAVILALLIRKFLILPIEVPTLSMYPTIKKEDKIIATRIYNKDSIKRGDILVFISEELNNERLIKRVIGLPGDEVVITDKGEMFINGKKYDEPYVVFNENRPGNFKVPKDSYLFMGDNRADSFDARRWKSPYIPYKCIEGKAQFIIFPFNRFGKFVYGQKALKWKSILLTKLVLLK